MVSNRELKERLYEKRTGSDIKEYLVCDTCKGSYELQPGEKPEDFSSECECGGKLTPNKDIPSSNKNTKLRKIIIGGSALFVVFMFLAIFIFPILYSIVYFGYMESQSSINKNVGTSADYDELNHITSSYDSLESQYQGLGNNIYNTKNANVKSAYANAELQLENTNTTISNVDTALSTGQPQSEVNSRINAAQSQLLIAQKSINNVTSMM